MQLLIKRVTNLLKIKSLVTLTLTSVFAYLCIIGHVSTDQFLTIFTVVIAFYFGTQASRKEDAPEAAANAAAETPDVKA